MNDKQKALVLEAVEKAKGLANADVSVVWRGGQLVDVQVTEIFDREKVKSTNR